MRRLMILVGLVAALCIAALLTKPGEEAAEARLNAALRAQVDRQDIAEQDDLIGTAALIGCKLRPQECVGLLRRGVEMTVEDRTLYTKVEISGLERDARCYGAFGRFWCRGGKGLTAGDG